MDASKITPGVPVQEVVAKENVRLITQFPGLGNRAITTLYSWWTPTPPGDSLARIRTTANHILSRPSNLSWVKQVGYEYAGYTENLSALNETIMFTFDKVFGRLEPVSKLLSEKGESKNAEQADVHFEETTAQLTEYKNALKGLRNLCLVYGSRYQQTLNQQKELAGLFEIYATECRKFCALQGLSGQALEERIRQEMHDMRVEIDPIVKQQTFRELQEGPLKQRALHAIQGLHSDEEIQADKPLESEFVYEGRQIMLHPQVFVDIERTAILISGERIDLDHPSGTITSLMNKENFNRALFMLRHPTKLFEQSEPPAEADKNAKRIETVLGKLVSRFGAEYSDEALARMLQIIVAQTFTSAAGILATEKFGGAVGDKMLGLVKIPASYTSAISQEGEDIVFTKKASFYKVDRNLDLDPTKMAKQAESEVGTIFKIYIPKSNFIHNAFRAEDLANVYMECFLQEKHLRG